MATRAPKSAPATAGRPARERARGPGTGGERYDGGAVARHGGRARELAHPPQGLRGDPVLHARRDQEGERAGPQSRLDLRAGRHRGRRHLAARRPRGHPDRRGRLHVRHRRLGSVYKLDITQGPGKLVWKMDPGTDKDWSGAVSCCGVNNRGVALWQDKVISHTLDGRLIATDKETGEVAWERQVADPAIAEVITVAPLVVKDLAITGVSGAEYGIRGWIAATDLNTGKEVAPAHHPRTRRAGHDTWADEHDAWKTGGGSTWVTGSYDPETDLIIWGGQPRTRLGRRVPPGGQSVHQQRDRPRPGYRRDQVALPVHAERPRL